MCIVGDLFDLVRSPSWFEGRQRPYHNATNNGVVKAVERIVEETLKREADFFSALREKMARGELRVHYVVGNHDRLLLSAKAAQQKIADALGIPTLVLHKELEFKDHGV